ncbi:MAG: c-type cytochrome [Akkermansiaceae bacterium]
MKTLTKSTRTAFSFPSMANYFAKITAIAAISAGTAFSTANAQDAHPGEALYKTKCIACHGPTGDGIPNVFPPVAGSEWVNGPAENLVRIQLRGLSGPITVKGNAFNSAMPPNATMTDQEIADVLTYVRSNLGNNAPAITAETVKTIRAKEAGNTAMLTVKDLIDPAAAAKEAPAEEAKPEVKPEAEATPATEPKPAPEPTPTPEPAPAPTPDAAATTGTGGAHPGQAIYQAKCIACHGPTGDGIPNTFPPLAGSEWVNGPAANLIKIQIHGLQGPIEVKGQMYNGMMPPNAAMSDEDIAHVLTYVRSNMGNSAAAVTPDMVKEIRAAAGPAPTAITAQDLETPVVATVGLDGPTELEGYKPAKSNSSGSTIFWVIGIIGVCTLPAVAGLAKNS